MSKLKVIILIIFIIILCIVIIQNTSTFAIRFLFWEFQMSIFAIPIIAVISIVIGYLISALRIRSRRKKTQS